MEALTKIKVLFRQSDTMALYGIPYEMRPGQSPRDLMRGSPRLPYGTHGAPFRPAGPREDWLWLGTPGWWGHFSPADQEAIKAFLVKHGDMVPTHPGEWSAL